MKKGSRGASWGDGLAVVATEEESGGNEEGVRGGDEEGGGEKGEFKHRQVSALTWEEKGGASRTRRGARDNATNR